MKLNFLAPFGKGRSSALSSGDRVNLFFEPAPAGSSEAGGYFMMPGYTLWQTVGNGPIRGELSSGGYGWVVSGTTLYRVRDTEISAIGTVPGDGLVSMAENETQIVVAHSEGWHRVVKDTLDYAVVTDAPKTANVAFVDNYLVFPTDDGRVGWSQPGDSVIDVLDFFTAEANPDKTLAVIADHRRLVMCGEKTLEWGIASGDPDQAFTRTSISEFGIEAKYSIVKTDNGIIWLGQNEEGDGRVYRATEGAPVAISDFAIEDVFKSYGDRSDAFAFVFQLGGHSWYVLSFPNRATWAYDLATQRWCQWAYRNPDTGALEQHRARCFMRIGSDRIIGDRESGKLYKLSDSVYTNDGEPIFWRWSGQTVENENRRIRHDRVTLISEMGVGLDGDVYGSDPKAILRWSDDGGATWPGFRTLTLGKIGERQAQSFTTRLGTARRRVYALEGSDPVKVGLFGLNLDARPLSA